MIKLVFILLTCSQIYAFAPKPGMIAARRVSISLNSFRLEQPSSDDAAAMGIREWPQQVKSTDYTETIEEGKEVSRYVLEGKGSVSFESSSRKEKKKVGPGSLINVTGPASLAWTVEKEMIILTPGYEQGGLLLGAVAVLIGLVAVIALTSG